MTRNERIRRHAGRVRDLINSNTRWVKVRVNDVHETHASFVCLDPLEHRELLKRLRRIELETLQGVSDIDV